MPSRRMSCGSSGVIRPSSPRCNGEEAAEPLVKRTSFKDAIAVDPEYALAYARLLASCMRDARITGLKMHVTTADVDLRAGATLRGVPSGSTAFLPLAPGSSSPAPAAKQNERSGPGAGHSRLPRSRQSLRPLARTGT